MLGLLTALKALDRIQTAPVLSEGRLCSRIRWHKSSCRLCLEACPAGAIRIDKHLVVDEARCKGCGVCISACPNGVFWSTTRGDGHLAREMAGVLAAGAEALWIGCQRCASDADPRIALPCLGRLTESLLLAPFALGVKVLYLTRPDCRGCGYGPGMRHFDQVLVLARALGRLVGLPEKAIRQVPAQGSPANLLSSTRARTTRRGLFSLARAQAVGMGAALLPWEDGENASQPLAHPTNKKRAYLLKVLESFEEYFPAVLKASGFPVAEVQIGANCVGCNVCDTLCPTGALTRVDQQGHVSIYFKGYACTGCGICIEACLFHAVDTKDLFSLETLVQGGQRELVRLREQSCPRCGQAFRASTLSLCPACRMRAKDA